MDPADKASNPDTLATVQLPDRKTTKGMLNRFFGKRNKARTEEAYQPLLAASGEKQTTSQVALRFADSMNRQMMGLSRLSKIGIFLLAGTLIYALVQNKKSAEAVKKQFDEIARNG